MKRDITKITLQSPSESLMMPDDFIALYPGSSASIIETRICHWQSSGYLALFQMHRNP